MVLQYLALIRALSDIADLGVEGLVYERCRIEARLLSEIFSQRLGKLSHQAQQPSHGVGGAAVGASGAVREADGEDA